MTPLEAFDSLLLCLCTSTRCVGFSGKAGGELFMLLGSKLPFFDGATFS